VRVLEALNPQQRQAVTHATGPLLILAGAGSGKTRVITYRIAHLISAIGVDPREIVAVTFTNKAAGEMKQRVESLLGREIAGAYVGTFHAFGLRLMRRHALEAGYSPGFVIYDSSDQQALVKQALAELKADEKAFPARAVLSEISRYKNALVDPDEALRQARFPHHKLYAQVYQAYDAALRRSSALDFDDLLVQPIRLLRSRPELGERYASQIRWLLVDEYQDTNPLQYALIRILSRVHQNICCVGDEDQSIYGFRGADIRNILDFERDFPNATIVKLEQNYRSTGTILSAASSVIANNQNRHEKTLWTENPRGERLTVRICQDDRSEADYIVDELIRRSRELGIGQDGVAILYRTNASSRLIEDRLTSRGINYRVVGSVRFYERKEIKDLVAWLRLLVNPDSDQDFLRAAATPPRGIGDGTLEELARRAASDSISLYEAARRWLEPPSTAPTRVQRALGGFFQALARITESTADGASAETLQLVLDEIDYLTYLEKAYPHEHAERAENLDALVSAAKEYDEQKSSEGLRGFLDRVTLRSDTDDNRGSSGPTLMTVHSAKGLEFPLIFVVGMNEGLFPHAMAEARSELEEERRLMYVALTRAERFAVLTAARFRYHYGRATYAEPSPFLDEIPAELKQVSVEGGEPLIDRRSTLRGRVFEPTPSRTPAAGTMLRANQTRTVIYDHDHSDDRPRYPVGTRVVHPSFGPGVVLATSGQGERLTLDISFQRAGRKKILPHYTQLSVGSP
jgi:DNA helicase-2/ATP-dependent DNA helicase PcrA